MKQLVFIHGGESFDTYESYLEMLRTWDYVPPSKDEPKRWKHALAHELEANGWEVHMPSMPSKNNAKYAEWKIWFEKVVPYLKDGVVLVGHSLGGIFLAKYLSEETIPVSVRATFIIAAPFDNTEPGESLADFILPVSLARLAEQGGDIFLYHSEDDDVVPFGELGKYWEHLPEAEVRTFTDRGHFLGSEFPELLECIRTA
jgi:uncharacterized protein